MTYFKPLDLLPAPLENQEVLFPSPNLPHSQSVVPKNPDSHPSNITCWKLPSQDILTASLT